MKKLITFAASFFLFIYLIPTDAQASTFLDYTKTTVDYTGVVAADLDGDGNDELVVDYGAQGLYMYESSTDTWTLLNVNDPDAVVVGNFNIEAAEELAVDFGSLGWYIYDPQSIPKWFHVDLKNPKNMYVFEYDDPTGEPSDEILIDYGPGLGLRVYDPSTNIRTVLNPNTAEFLLAQSFDGAANDELLVDFGTLGLWFWDYGWTKLTKSNIANYMIAAELDGSGYNTSTEAMIDYGFLIGLKSYDFPGTFTQLNPNSPTMMESVNFFAFTADDEVAVAFPGLGLYYYDPGAIPLWTAINPNLPESLCAVNLDQLDEELAVDFGAGIGLYVYSRDAGSWFPAGWTKINPNDAEFMVRARLSGLGQLEELVVDFGPGIGLYIYYYDIIAARHVWKQINPNSL